MAGYALIPIYLAELRRSMRGVLAFSDLIAEIEDHLISAVEARVGAGEPPGNAEKAVLAEFGDAKVIGRMLGDAEREGARVPTRFSITAGRILPLALITAAIAAVMFELSREAHRIYEPALGDRYGTVGIWFFWTTMAIFGLFGFSLISRLGIRRTTSGVVASVAICLALLSSSLWWAVAVWTTLLFWGFATLAVAGRQASVSSPLALTAAVSGPLAMAAGGWWLYLFELLKPTYPVPSGPDRVMLAGFMITSIAVTIYGRAMAGESLPATGEPALTA